MLTKTHVEYTCLMHHSHSFYNWKSFWLHFKSNVFIAGGKGKQTNVLYVLFQQILWAPLRDFYGFL